MTLNTVDDMPPPEQDAMTTRMDDLSSSTLTNDIDSTDEESPMDKLDDPNLLELHVSFVSKKTDFKITDTRIRGILSKFGLIKGFCMKKYAANQEVRNQSGYGFAAYDDVEEAIKTMRQIKDNLIEHISFDCHLSHRSMQKITNEQQDSVRQLMDQLEERKMRRTRGRQSQSQQQQGNNKKAGSQQQQQQWGSRSNGYGNKHQGNAAPIIIHMMPPPMSYMPYGPYGAMPMAYPPMSPHAPVYIAMAPPNHFRQQTSSSESEQQGEGSGAYPYPAVPMFAYPLDFSQGGMLPFNPYAYMQQQQQLSTPSCSSGEVSPRSMDDTVA